MTEATQNPDQQTGSKGKSLFVVMLVIIVVSIVAFLVFRPNPSGAGHTTTPSQNGSTGNVTPAPH